MDSPNIWLLGFFLLVEVPMLSMGYFKEYLLLSVIFSEAFLFRAFLYKITDSWWEITLRCFLCSTFPGKKSQGHSQYNALWTYDILDAAAGGDICKYPGFWARKILGKILRHFLFFLPYMQPAILFSATAWHHMLYNAWWEKLNSIWRTPGKFYIVM